MARTREEQRANLRRLDVLVAARDAARAADEHYTEVMRATREAGATVPEIAEVVEMSERGVYKRLDRRPVVSAEGSA